MLDEEDAPRDGVAVIVQAEVQPFEQVREVVHGQLQVDGEQGYLRRLAFVEEEVGVLMVAEETGALVRKVVSAVVHHLDVIAVLRRTDEVRLGLQRLAGGGQAVAHVNAAVVVGILRGACHFFGHQHCPDSRLLPG